MNIGKVIWQISTLLEEIIRIVSMQFILIPAAFALPKKWSLGVAKAISLLLVFLPHPGFQMYWNMRDAFGKDRRESFFLTWNYLARSYIDFVALKRLYYKREDPHKWKIVEKNTDGIDSLRASGESYIVAIGHFLREIIFSLISPAVTYGQPVQLSLIPPKKIRRLYDIRIHIQFAMWQKDDFAGWGRDSEFVFVGAKPPPFRTLFKRLCKKGNVVFIHVDAPWKKSKSGSFERSFAGHRNRVFATGTAQLARITKRPVISCIHSLESDGTIVLDWGTPIRCENNKEDDDIAVMNQLLDKQEIAIGERPAQYVLDIGCERQWNSQKKRWEDVN